MGLLNVFLLLMMMVCAAAPQKTAPQKTAPQKTSQHAWRRWGGLSTTAQSHTTNLPFWDHMEARRVRALSVDPPIFYIENFITYEEAEAIMLEAAPRLAPSRVVYSTSGQTGDSDTRVSSQATFRRGDHEVLDNISYRLRVLLASPNYTFADELLPLEEAFQVIRYKAGGHFACHHDPFDVHEHKPHVWDGSPYNRFVTALVYLHLTREAGGELQFCRYRQLHWDALPLSLVFWYNLHQPLAEDEDVRCDGRFEHRSLPLVGNEEASKWVISAWYHYRRHESAIGQDLP